MSILAPAVRLGAVHLTVADLARSVAFYRDAIGLRVHHVSPASVSLGAGRRDLVILHEDRDGRPALGHARLGHVALNCSTVRELARALVRLEAAGVPLSDTRAFPQHTALYVEDPDGVGVELAHDRPDELLTSFADPDALRHEPVDLDALRALVAGEPLRPPADPKLAVGHVHLLVGDIPEGMAFYRDGLGFALQAEPPDEAYLTAGSPHPHLALGSGTLDAELAAPAHALGLRCWTVVMPDSAAVTAAARRLRRQGVTVHEHDGIAAARDPWGLGVALVPSGD